MVSSDVCLRLLLHVVFFKQRYSKFLFQKSIFWEVPLTLFLCFSHACILKYKSFMCNPIDTNQQTFTRLYVLRRNKKSRDLSFTQCVCKSYMSWKLSVFLLYQINFKRDLICNQASILNFVYFQLLCFVLFLYDIVFCFCRFLFFLQVMFLQAFAFCTYLTFLVKK